MKYKYSFENGVFPIVLKQTPTHDFVLYLNHPVGFYTVETQNVVVLNDYTDEHTETRSKISLHTGASFIHDTTDGYWYLGIIILGFGVALSKCGR